jgi:hypothetical protein
MNAAEACSMCARGGRACGDELSVRGSSSPQYLWSAVYTVDTFHWSSSLRHLPERGANQQSSTQGASVSRAEGPSISTRVQGPSGRSPCERRRACGDELSVRGSSSPQYLWSAVYTVDIIQLIQQAREERKMPLRLPFRRPRRDECRRGLQHIAV